MSASRASPHHFHVGTTAQPGPGGLRGNGLEANYFDVATGEQFWISGPKKDGTDRLYGERVPVDIDDDVREEYWSVIRRQPDRSDETVANR